MRALPIPPPRPGHLSSLFFRDEGHSALLWLSFLTCKMGVWEEVSKMTPYDSGLLVVTPLGKPLCLCVWAGARDLLLTNRIPKSDEMSLVRPIKKKSPEVYGPSPSTRSLPKPPRAGLQLMTVDPEFCTVASSLAFLKHLGT